MGYKALAPRAESSVHSNGATHRSFRLGGGGGVRPALACTQGKIFFYLCHSGLPAFKGEGSQRGFTLYHRRGLNPVPGVQDIQIALTHAHVSPEHTHEPRLSRD